MKLLGEYANKGGGPRLKLPVCGAPGTGVHRTPNSSGRNVPRPLSERPLELLSARHHGDAHELLVWVSSRLLLGLMRRFKPFVFDAETPAAVFTRSFMIILHMIHSCLRQRPQKVGNEVIFFVIHEDEWMIWDLGGSPLLPRVENADAIRREAKRVSGVQKFQRLPKKLQLKDGSDLRVLFFWQLGGVTTDLQIFNTLVEEFQIRNPRPQ